MRPLREQLHISPYEKGALGRRALRCVRADGGSCAGKFHVPAGATSRQLAHRKLLECRRGRNIPTPILESQCAGSTNADGEVASWSARAGRGTPLAQLWLQSLRTAHRLAFSSKVRCTQSGPSDPGEGAVFTGKVVRAISRLDSRLSSTQVETTISLFRAYSPLFNCLRLPRLL